MLIACSPLSIASAMAARARRSAGLIPYRFTGGRLEVLIGHMGGPRWSRRDEHAWSIIKGEHDEHEPALAAARREFTEETGAPVPEGPMLELGEVRQAGGKRVAAWALAAELDAAGLHSNTFTMEWPPRSGKHVEFPEIDRFAWCELDTARRRLVAAQATLLDQLERALAAGRADAPRGVA
jgi:predicted NUDIX family NTP pyrophosphohydrolase